jgi:hypothetical protein
MLTPNSANHVTSESPDVAGRDKDGLEGFAYVPRLDQPLDHSHCFLCGRDLATTDRCDEHVVPRWVLRDFRLYGQSLALPNGTSIEYARLTIPCCRECNSLWLHKLENVVARAVRAGPEQVQALDPAILALWMTKIHYGLAFKDLSLAADRANPADGSVLNERALEHLFELHWILQLARDELEIVGDECPASVFVLETLDPTHEQLRFDYRDLLLSPFLSIRLGRVGLIGCLMDWGAVAQLEPELLSEVRQQRLHPTQFAEVAALCAHWRARLNRTPKYMSIAGNQGRDQVIVSPLTGLAGGPIFDEFDPELYANLLARFTHNELDQVWNPETNQLWTSLRTPDGQPLQAPSDVVSIRPPGWPPPK